MSEDFLHEMRREPRPEFARALRERLRAQDVPTRAARWNAAPALALAAAVVLVVAVFTVPSVRVSAQAMLDLFRVRKFAVVPYDESRMEKLRSLGQNNAFMVFDHQESLHDPGPPQYYSTPDAAGAAAGIAVRRMSYLPNGLALDSVFVEGAAQARLSVDEVKLRALLDGLDLRDVTVPSGLNGQWVEVRKPPTVFQKFRAGSKEAGLIQGPSPEVSVPPSLDVVRLAEVGLRILGLDAGEAHRIATVTDWRSTLVVPVPANVSSFRQVTIHGQPGLLITTASVRSPGQDRRREGTIVMWTEGDWVFGVMSDLSPPDVVQMAESVR